MISGFEEYTKELSDLEIKIVPLLVEHLKSTSIESAKTRRILKAALWKQGFNVGDARLRKMINVIRRHNLVPRLCATSKGYYVSNDPKECRRYSDSLEQRIQAIEAMKRAFDMQAYEYFD